MIDTKRTRAKKPGYMSDQKSDQDWLAFRRICGDCGWIESLLREDGVEHDVLK